MGKEWVKDKQRHTEFKLSVRAEMKALVLTNVIKNALQSILKIYLSRMKFMITN